MAGPLTILYITTKPMALQVLHAEQLRFMGEQGFNVHAASSGGSELTNVGLNFDVQVHPIPFKNAFSPFTDLLCLLKLFQLMGKLKPHIVQVSTPKAALLGSLAAWITRIPIRLLLLRGLLTEGFEGSRRSIIRLVEKLTCIAVHHVIAISPSLAENAANMDICPAWKISVLSNGSSNGIDAHNLFNPQNVSFEQRQNLRARIGLDENDILLGYVGRIVANKGIWELCGAWSKLKMKHKNLKLVIIGSEEHHNPVPKDIMDTLRKDRGVTFIPWTNYENLPVYYSIMDIFLFPSYREGFGNVLLEAAAMGIPAVAANVTGVKDAVAHNISGILVPAKDVDSLVSAVEYYINDPALRSLHGVQGRRRVLEKFDRKRMWQAYLEFYLKTYGDRNPSNIPKSPIQ